MTLSNSPRDGAVRRIPRNDVRRRQLLGRQLRGIAVLRIGDDEVAAFADKVPDKPRSAKGPVAHVPLHELDGFVRVNLWGRFAGHDVVVMSIDDRTVSFYANGPPSWGEEHGLQGSQHQGYSGTVGQRRGRDRGGKRSSTCSQGRCGGRASTCEPTSGDHLQRPLRTPSSGPSWRTASPMSAGRLHAGAGPAQPWGRRAARTMEPRSRTPAVSPRRSLPAHIPASAASGTTDSDCGDDRRCDRAGGCATIASPSDS